jgi:integrase
MRVKLDVTSGHDGIQLSEVQRPKRRRARKDGALIPAHDRAGAFSGAGRDLREYLEELVPIVPAPRQPRKMSLSSIVPAEESRARSDAARSGLRHAWEEHLKAGGNGRPVDWRTVRAKFPHAGMGGEDKNLVHDVGNLLKLLDALRIELEQAELLDPS